MLPSDTGCRGCDGAGTRNAAEDSLAVLELDDEPTRSASSDELDANTENRIALK
jgi:hypothetical protein